jgi:maltokinase
MISGTDLEVMLPDYLVQQRWFAAGPDGSQPRDVADLRARIVRSEVWREGDPGLLWAIVEVTQAGAPPGRYQILVGTRAAAVLPHIFAGKEQWVIGTLPGPDGGQVVYGALIDPELAVTLVDRVAPSLGGVRGVRALAVEQTNTSIVADEQWICKLFRRLQVGDNPDVDVALKLWAHGFTETPEPVAAWREDDIDLAVVRRFEPGGTDGFVLASTSLRDLYDSRLDPADSGGDFAPEAFRLGGMVARMHRALAEAYGTSTVQTADVIAQVADEMVRAEVPEVTSLDVATWAGRCERTLPGELGVSRLHGDLHLGQVLRCDRGWLVLDFEGEPSRPLSERTAFASPWRDVGAMLRSFDYAVQLTLQVHPDESGDDTLDEGRAELGAAWRLRNRAAFCNGYIADLPPMAQVDEDVVPRLMRFFELAKATYEVGYERSHRPELAFIPERAVRALLDEP